MCLRSIVYQDKHLLTSISRHDTARGTPEFSGCNALKREFTSEG